ncbi:Uncharacterised protein [Klebsiella pneumoniae]|nr:hypothetical protein AM421_004775 [Klebsiella pneumoniae]SAU23247.1 Uncharacterised protein [Klebsiella pneumoniae]SBF59424.1 Uncharacterised protein [Klebsiella pneumoniae]SBF76482.1 Uncharacterised protein [Klebsiella pneumoniae]SBH54483.1 Uncharacterised protein [Klebsiella pneumoniae]
MDVLVIEENVWFKRLQDFCFFYPAQKKSFIDVYPPTSQRFDNAHV